MAFYMLSVKPLSRAKGACATRYAAYRAGERIRDERTHSTHNFTSRKDVIHKQILLPSVFSADKSMDWARDRATLWNTVESTVRRNARVGREVLVVLPKELDSTQRTKLALRFGQELANRYLAAVDVTVHPPRPQSSEVNHHAHLLLTPRQVTPEGLGQRTIFELMGRDLHALGLGSSKNELLLNRERWAQLTNESLREAGLDLRVDHRSLRARGIDREPALQIPHNILCMERRTGMPSKAGEAIRANYRERLEARQKGPEALELVLERQKDSARQAALDRANRAPDPPKGIWSATYTAEERLEMHRELLSRDETLRERQRAYRQKNAELINQKAREARHQAQLSPAQQSARHWQKWRLKQQELELRQTRSQQKALGHEKQTTPPLSLGITAEQAARNWLSYRERHKQLELPKIAGQRRAEEHALEKTKVHTHDYDYGL
jgi:hypothetical protein